MLIRSDGCRVTVRVAASSTAERNAIRGPPRSVISAVKGSATGEQTTAAAVVSSVDWGRTTTVKLRLAPLARSPSEKRSIPGSRSRRGLAGRPTFRVDWIWAGPDLRPWSRAAMRGSAPPPGPAGAAPFSRNPQ